MAFGGSQGAACLVGEPLTSKYSLWGGCSCMSEGGRRTPSGFSVVCNSCGSCFHRDSLSMPFFGSFPCRGSCSCLPLVFQLSFGTASLSAHLSPTIASALFGGSSRGGLKLHQMRATMSAAIFLFPVVVVVSSRYFSCCFSWLQLLLPASGASIPHNSGFCDTSCALW